MIIRIQTLFLAVLCSGLLYGQEIVQLEYYWNNDPGVGNALAIEVNPTDQFLDNITIQQSGLQPGLNKLGVRSKDINGHWSISEELWVMVNDDQTYDLVWGEYFWDTDPGVGNGSIITFPAGEQFDGELSISNNGIELGDHKLQIRTVDERGHWSLYHSETITICASFPVEASFDISIEGQDWNMTNMSLFADSYEWYIDGTLLSTDENFTYNPLGESELCLIASSDCYADTLCTSIGATTLISVDPESLPNSGNQSIDITGFALEDGSQIRIEQGLVSIQALSVSFQNDQLLIAEFDFDNEELGLYDLILVRPNNEELTLLDALELTPFIGVSDSQYISNIIAYPNPAEDRIQIKFNNSPGPCILRVVDLTGRIVVETELNPSEQIISLECANWMDGIYQLSLIMKRDPGIIKTLPIMILH